MKRGDVYSTPKGGTLSQNFFRRGNLIALRELACARSLNRLTAASNLTWNGGHPENWRCGSASPSVSHRILRGSTDRSSTAIGTRGRDLRGSRDREFGVKEQTRTLSRQSTFRGRPSAQVVRLEAEVLPTVWLNCPLEHIRR